MNFCTLFNSQYLSRGLALYHSLLKNAKEFHLYIFAFDDVTFQILSTMNLKAVTVISLEDFETPDLLRVKKERTIAEYCWTCTSSTILYCLEKYHLPAVCYLDADLYFWQDPAILLTEAKNHSILITEHRYTKQYDHSAVSGKYCVQFMYFKNDANGLEALKWWRNACIEWCYNRVEPGRFGDQKYLDDWLECFQGVKVLAHLGGGVAPWNVQQYDIIYPQQMIFRVGAKPSSNRSVYKIHEDCERGAGNTPENSAAKGVPLSFEKVSLVECASNNEFDLIFYHFHGLKFVNDKIDFGGYKLSQSVVEIIYHPYVKTLLRLEQELNKNVRISPLLTTANVHCKITKAFSLIEWAKDVKKKIMGIYNVFPMVNFKVQ